MQLSEGELYRLSQRVFFALGFPAGADYEAAMAVKWLAAHGFPAVNQLHSKIPELRACPYQSVEISQDARGGFELNTSKDIGYFAVFEAVEFICAGVSSKEIESSTALISGLKIPSLLIPLALRWSNTGLVFDIQISTAHLFFDNGLLWTNFELNKLGLLLDNSNARLWCNSCELTNRKAEKAKSELVLQDLNSYRDTGRASGLQVDDKIWFDLKTVAYEGFVPESELSRQHGAGAEAGDSD